MAKHPPTDAQPEPTSATPEWTPERALQQLAPSRAELIASGDRIAVRGFLPHWLEQELADPANYAAMHAHLTEIARQQAEQAAEEARQARENDWIARVNYGSIGGGHFRQVEIAKLKRELERRATATKKASRK